MHEMRIGGGVTSLVCIRDELMAATKDGHILRVGWDASINRDYSLTLTRIPFCTDKQVALGNVYIQSTQYMVKF